MLIDDVVIKVSSGRGGRGAVAFNKNMKSLGPAGGSGGNGGDVVVEAASDLSLLNQFRFKKEISAESGEPGKPQFNDGHTGVDLVLKVPVGTIIHNMTTGADYELVKINERIVIAKGGKGGRGNFHFKSSTNTSPVQYQNGTPGEEFMLRLELKLIADVGIIGLPSAGKSSLLNELTNAQSKVGNYPFTTLEPSLGVYYELILADIPGLIEGSSQGKGLGDKFLRHIERTEILFHLVPADSLDPVHDYEIIRKELGAHNPALLTKKEYLFLSKSDMVSEPELDAKIALLKKLNPTVIPISVYNWESLDAVKRLLNAVIKEKHYTTPEVKEVVTEE
ncbi:MAG: GTPase ObgE [uncultured bacterium]|uniref:GTPase Obg n=2 Tax=Candidatus Wolfeibacteriota TaxID=1752735 RepID=A0A0G1K7N7_9BACT|nr:MAG: GTPase ObgE [uncultured bacterium]KKR12956.1 MAG: GTPase obg [Candidatus Wolfebacteria bacterium GW2011_GWC2_39_22]KKT43884.1 MAG: GTPase obg [Candidatus Wolfebacteria bacterium GW2011_GWE2_44_13]HBI25389.1 GTPase ObgE [Candidatus Wolfebacteria bacterium]